MAADVAHSCARTSQRARRQCTPRAPHADSRATAGLGPARAPHSCGRSARPRRRRHARTRPAQPARATQACARAAASGRARRRLHSQKGSGRPAGRRA
jgi:hypothetical protein